MNRLFAFIRKYKIYLLLLIVFLLALGWQTLWAGEALLRWWPRLYGILPDEVFFEWEEFIALNSHGNTWVSSLGLWCFSLLVIVLAIRYGLRRKNIRLGTLIGMIVLFLIIACLLLPCLCRAREYGKRISCQSNLKHSGLLLTQYVQENQNFPVTLDIEIGRASKISVTLPPEKKTSDERFVIFEDAPRTHAGDLRHRLWSDGKIESHYPWKAEGVAK